MIIRTLDVIIIHQGKVLGVDIARDEKHFVSASYDRTWKLWAVEEEF